ncbi:hypothetical protein BKA83DRAFT_4129004 [Pisolithus microcarpus]|nr:hypothetical protein BKA83DRAFT_4129004 [Pisolithus microcarpus]
MTSESSSDATSSVLSLYGDVKLPSGCYFPFSGPHDVDVTRLLQRDLAVTLAGDRVEIIDMITLKPFTTAPLHYWDLIRRLLWRRAIYCKILGGDILNSFEDQPAQSIRCNAVYLDSVLDWVKRPLKIAANSNPPGCVRLLDIYMLEEFYVGRHEPSAYICWQRKNPTINLRGGDILSKSFNWQESAQRFGHAWEGMHYRWTTQSLSGKCLENVVDNCKALFEDFYDHPYPRMDIHPEDTEETRCYGGVCPELCVSPKAGEAELAEMDGRS